MLTVLQIFLHYQGDMSNEIIGLKHELRKSEIFLFVRGMLLGMLVNFSLPGFTCLVATRLTTGPETFLPVAFELMVAGELFLAPSVATKVPLAYQRFIGIMVSEKNCQKMKV